MQKAIVSEGFSEEDLKTESFSIYPNTNWVNGKEIQDGYIAYHYLKLEFSMERLSKLTSVIDAGANAGAGINSINFELTPESQNKYKAEALKLASEDAQTKADAVAEGFGKKTGKLVSVQVSQFNYYPWRIYSASGISEDFAVAKESVINLQPSEEEVSASVSATFKLQ